MGNFQAKFLLTSKIFRFFIPRDNVWAKRILLVFMFILFDYVATVIFCVSPSDEGNIMARVFMENYGIAPGLALFDFIINLPVYLLLSFSSHLIILPSKWNKIANSLTDFILALFVANPHFEGGISWIPAIREFPGTVIGAAIYIILAAVYIDYKIFKS